jgi:hypothetical protein
MRRNTMANSAPEEIIDTWTKSRSQAKRPPMSRLLAIMRVVSLPPAIKVSLGKMMMLATDYPHVKLGTGDGAGWGKNRGSWRDSSRQMDGPQFQNIQDFHSIKTGSCGIALPR